MTYQFKPGAYLRCDPNVAGEVCENLEREGRLTAKDLVDVSRPVDAPLHGQFEWDNSIAAERYREQQARHIIGSLEVVVEDTSPVRAYFNVERAAPEYRAIDRILSSEDLTADLMKTALGELKAFEKKYRQLTGLAAVFREIDAVIELRSSDSERLAM